MTVVVPTLLAHSKDELDALTTRYVPFAKRIHLDLMDGQFTPTPSVTVPEIVLPTEWEVDVHMMYADPLTNLPPVIAMKPSLIIIHAEAQGELMKGVEAIQKANIKAGLALMRSTVPADVAELLAVVDHVLIFSGNLGEYGGTANMLQIEKIRLIREINPAIEVGWDGGANISNTYTLSLGGVDVVNVGNALASAPDPAEVYRQLDFEAHRKDVLQQQKTKAEAQKEAAENQ